METRELEERKGNRQNIMSTSRTNERRKSHNMAEAFEKDYIRDSSSFHPTVNIENTINQAEKIDFSKKNISLSDESSEDQDMQII